ncbi:MAG TPA: methyltransferase domain-containing protein [Pirellulaceae bacterium]|jgi:trans-aconitate methyltransferase|nr:methyltransferase domain-containing protein [Pirellulaceae bacterium]
MADDDDLPDYAETLDAQHAAHEVELRAMIGQVCEGKVWKRAADLACGDGFFTRLLAEALPDAEVVGLDDDDAYLKAARKASQGWVNVRYERADALDPAESLGRFSLVFCADSLESIEDHDGLLAGSLRLCEPGGAIVYTETDSVHEVICPWPLSIERKLRELEAKALSPAHRRGYAFPRYAKDLFARHGLVDVTIRSFTFDRNGPLDEATAKWLALELADRLEKVRPVASDEEITELRRHLTPEGDGYVGAGESTYVTFLRYVILGTRPA